MTDLPAQDGNKIILDAINTGSRLPPGDISFVPPINLTGGMSLRGSLAPGGTWLRPLYNGSVPIVNIDNTNNWQPVVVRDLNIGGHGPSGLEYGFIVNGANIALENVRADNLYCGMAFAFSVYNSVNRAMLTNNQFGLIILDSPVTTTTFREVHFSHSIYHGALVRAGADIVFEDCIFESNANFGLVIEGPNVGRAFVERCWFEDNPHHYSDPLGRVVFGPCRFV